MVAKKIGLEAHEKKPEKETIPEEEKPLKQAAKSPIKSQIEKGSLVELKAFAKPPVLVHTTLRAWFLLLGYGDCSWADSKKVLSDSTLLKRVSEFDPSSVKSADMKKSKIILAKESRESVAKVSAGLSSIVTWVCTFILTESIYRSIIV